MRVGCRKQGTVGCAFGENGQSMEEMVDQRHLHLHHDRSFCLHCLSWPCRPVSPGAGNTHQMLPRNHLHWIQQIQRIQLAPLPSSQLVSHHPHTIPLPPVAMLAYNRYFLLVATYFLFGDNFYYYYPDYHSFGVVSCACSRCVSCSHDATSAL